MDERLGFPKQRKYKIELVKKGIKVKQAAIDIECNYSMLSQYINGRQYMPEVIKNKLDDYLNM